MLLHDLVTTSDEVGDTAGRLAKIDLLAGLLKEAEGEELDVAIAFLSGEPRQGKIGVGWATVRDARPATGASAPALELIRVDAALGEIAALRGSGSAGRKKEVLAWLLAAATPEELSFLSRLLVGELRQGALEGVVVEAVATATGLPADRVRRAVMVTGDLATVAKAALRGGAEGLASCSIRLFTPLRPMLAQPTDGVDDALGQLGEAALELKLDGARIQVHRDGDEVRVYSRRLNDVTAAVPEVVELARSLAERRLILDGEVIALRDDGTPHPFQVTMRRFGRKLDVDRQRRTLPLTPFFFVPGRPGAPLRPRQALPKGQRGGRGRHLRGGEKALPGDHRGGAAAATRLTGRRRAQPPNSRLKCRVVWSFQ